MSEKKFEVYDLKVNQITEALGMDVEKPVFSWKLRAEKQNTMQKQAQILPRFYFTFLYGTAFSN